MSPASITITALDGIPRVKAGDDLGALLIAALDGAGLAPRRFDILVIAQKIVSKAEGRLLDLATLTPSARAVEIAEIADKDARLVEAILRESVEIVRVKRGVIIAATKGGLVMANAGIDKSNLDEPDHDKRVLLLPEDPDRSATLLKARLDAHYAADIGIIISDSVGRAWRQGSVGLAIGAAGVPSLQDRRGEPDLSGRLLEVTEVGFADSVATAAVLAMGEAAEGRPAALVRGLEWTQAPRSAAALVRPKNQDLFPVSNPGACATTYVALSGGVGGAKLSLGLNHLLGERLTIIVNTGDDFEHLGLHVSPDIDTALYTLADLVNPETGWGRRDESWNFMEAVAQLGGPSWFKLGDRDLATHVERSRRLRAGERLADICTQMRQRLGIAAHVLPMSDDPVRTIVDTDAGTLAFQEYFVREQCRPRVRSIRFDGAADAKVQMRCLDALASPDLAGVIICPSNPYLSVDPILAVPGMTTALRACRAPIVAVTPIVGGKAIKGPAAKIMGELGLSSDAATVARHYDGLIAGFVLDEQDAGHEAGMTMPTLATNTVMRTQEDKITLARRCVDFCDRLTRMR